MIVRTYCTGFFEYVDVNYGVEEYGLPGNDQESEGVTIPQVTFSPISEHFQMFQQDVNPLTVSDNIKIELHEKTLHFICTMIS